jgi:hypothetical protein
VTERAASKAALSEQVARAEADVEQARERVSSSVLALRDELARQSDWRRWLVRHPLASLGGALALGFVIGKVARRR